jgi:hypothetical protein
MLQVRILCVRFSVKANARATEYYSHVPSAVEAVLRKRHLDILQVCCGAAESASLQ